MDDRHHKHDKLVGRVHVGEFFGIPVYLDPTVEPGCVRFTDDMGDTVGVIERIEFGLLAERRGRDSDPGTQLCRLPPNHSATAPESRG